MMGVDCSVLRSKILYDYVQFWTMGLVYFITEVLTRGIKSCQVNIQRFYLMHIPLKLGVHSTFSSIL